MDTVVVVRHGETAWNREGRIQGWAPTTLTEPGRSTATGLGTALEAAYDIEAIRSSDLRRAEETTGCLRRSLDAPVRFDAAWRERDFGVCQGLLADELFGRFPELSVTEAGADAIDRAPDGGESLTAVRERVLDAWEGVLEATTGTTLVVTHGGPLYVLLSHLKGIDLPRAIDEHAPHNCGVYEIAIDEADPRFVWENLLPDELDGVADGPPADQSHPGYRRVK